MDAANYSRSSRILLIFVLTFPNLFQWDTTKRIATPKMIPKMFADSTRPMARSIIVLPARKINKSFIILYFEYFSYSLGIFLTQGIFVLLFLAAQEHLAIAVVPEKFCIAKPFLQSIKNIVVPFNREIFILDEHTELVTASLPRRINVCDLNSKIFHNFRTLE